MNNNMFTKPTAATNFDTVSYYQYLDINLQDQLTDLTSFFVFTNLFFKNHCLIKDIIKAVGYDELNNCYYNIFGIRKTLRECLEAAIHFNESGEIIKLTALLNINNSQPKRR